MTRVLHTRLSNAEVFLLKKGLNFAVTPANIQATEIIANFESAVRPQNAEQTDNVRRTVNDILTALKKTSRSWSSDEGRASVGLDTDTYHDKVSALIGTGPHTLIKKDPTDRQTWKLSEKLLSLKRNGHISEAVYDKIRPRRK